MKKNNRFEKDITQVAVDGKYKVTITHKKCNIMLAVNEYGWERKVAGSVCGPTVRDSFILHFVEQGKGSFDVCGRHYELKSGDCFLIPAHEQVYYKADKEEPWSYYWIGFEGVEAKDLLMRSGLIKNQTFVIQPADFNKLIERLQTFNCLQIEKETIEYVLLGNLYLLFADLLCEAKTTEKTNQDYIERAVEYMNSNYNEFITVRDVANYLGLNRSYFYRLFQQKMAISPADYLLNLRLEEAKKLLLVTKKPIKDIAITVGYQNYLSFVKVFKEKIGFTPTEYRNGDFFNNNCCTFSNRS